MGRGRAQRPHITWDARGTGQRLGMARGPHPRPLIHRRRRRVFISGCAKNMGKFYPQFDHIVLLSAPVAVIMERLAARTTNPYGKRPEEVARVLGLLRTVEPLLRKAAGHEIDTALLSTRWWQKCYSS